MSSTSSAKLQNSGKDGSTYQSVGRATAQAERAAVLRYDDDSGPTAEHGGDSSDATAASGYVGDGGQEEVRTGTVFGMTFNTITNIIGGGVLDLPSAMYQASIAVGCVLCVLSSVASSFAVYVLVQACDVHERYSMMEIWAYSLFPPATCAEYDAMNEKRRKFLRGVALNPNPIEDDVTVRELELFAASEKRKAQWRVRMSNLMIVLIFLYNFGCLVLYGVVIGDSVPPVVQNFFHGDGLWIQKGTWLIAGGVIFFGLSCARKMDELRWSSVLGFVTILYVIVAVVVRYFTLRANPEDMPSFDSDTGDVEYAKLDIGFANAMTTFGLAYCYHYNVPFFYGELQDRRSSVMMKTAAYAQPVTFVSYLVTGVFGYLTFGKAVDNAHSGGNIVSNYADDDTLVNIGRFGLFFHFCCVYPILSVSCRRGLHHLLEFYWWAPRRNRQDDERTAIRHAGHHAACNAEEGSSIPSVCSGQATADDGGGGNGASSSSTTGQAHLHHVATLAFHHPDAIIEQPTRLVIGVEAFAIVSASIVFAWFAPGIKLVVNVTGSLFGLFLMLIAPGIIGLRIFLLEGMRPNRCLAFSSLVLLLMGLVMMVASFYTIVT